MKNKFSKIFLESAIPDGYKAPTTKATFQLNDVVIVRSEGNTIKYSRSVFIARNPKKNLKYFNKVGKIIGYKAGTMSAKFAVEFSDKTFASFNTAHLIGPFRTKEDALEATKFDTNSIPPNLFAKYVERKTESPTFIEIEQKFKTFFVNDDYKFVWLDTPISVPCELPGKPLNLSILAYRDDFEQTIKSEEGPFPYFAGFNLPSKFKNCYFLFKIFNRITGKLVIQNIATRESLSDKTNGNTGYYITFPEPIKRFYSDIQSIQRDILKKTYSNLIHHSIEGLPKKVDLKFKNISSYFDKLQKVLTVKTFSEYFDASHGVFEKNGLKVIESNDVYFDLERQLPHTFDLTRYEINGNCEVRLGKKLTKIISPKIVTGNIRIEASNQKLQNLSGLPQIIGGNIDVHCGELDSLEYCPETVNGDFNLLLGSSLKNLKFLPKTINGNFLLTCPVNSFVGGEDTTISKEFKIVGSQQEETTKNLAGLPKANKYNIGITEKRITDHFSIKELEDEFPEIKNTF